MINTDSTPQRYDIGGTPFEVVAIDGTDLVGPTPLSGRTLVLAAGGRYDIGIHDAACARQARRRGHARRAGAEPRRDRRSAAAAERAGVRSGRVRPARRRRRSTRRATSTATFELEVGRKPGFLDGKPGMQWSINGGIFPRVPMFMVEEGDLVRISIEQHDERRASDAPPRPSHARAQPRRQARVAAAPGGATRSTSSRASGTRSPSAPTTPASGWITATT